MVDLGKPAQLIGQRTQSLRPGPRLRAGAERQGAALRRRRPDGRLARRGPPPFAAPGRADWRPAPPPLGPPQGDPGDPDLPATPVTVAELLHRTVLYQVGHPASQ